jgi:threonine dehydrogenase-like Zn-dependent dehydrogenase
VKPPVRPKQSPGKVFDRSVGIDEAPAGYAAMDAREALKVMITF